MRVVVVIGPKNGFVDLGHGEANLLRMRNTERKCDIDCVRSMQFDSVRCLTHAEREMRNKI